MFRHFYTWPEHPKCSESFDSNPLSKSTKAPGPCLKSHVPHFTSVDQVPSSVSPSLSPMPPWSWIPLTCRSCVQQSEVMFPLVGLHFPRTSASWTLSLSIHPHSINHWGSCVAPPRTSQAFNALNKPLIYSPAPWNRRVDNLSLVYCDHNTEFCSTDITEGWNT